MSRTFVAIDFETAHYAPDSACAIGVVRVVDGRIAAAIHRLIRPPRRDVMFTEIHGLRWADLRDQPSFADVWPELAPMLDGAAFLAAHNASFDRRVLAACCASAGLRAPTLPWLCTVKLARKAWEIRPTKLPDVARRLELELNHHDALSDAECCANIVVRGWPRVPELLPDLA